MECNCKDWKNNIELLNAPMVLQAIRTSTDGYIGRTSTDGYMGKKFTHCPWCGEPLTAEQVK